MGQEDISNPRIADSVTKIPVLPLRDVVFIRTW